MHTIAKSLDAGVQTDVIYLDMAKAFDKVPHEKLLNKLEMAVVRPVNSLLGFEVI